MSRNVITEEVVRERGKGNGAYTFNSFPPEDYEGFVLVVACIRLGDHAHITFESGRQLPRRDECMPDIRRSGAGRLVFPWHEWLLIRTILEAAPNTRIAEVEHPTQGQLERYAG